MQPSLSHKAVHTVSTLLVSQKRSDTLLFIVVFVTALGITPLLILAGASIGFSLTLGIIAALAITISIVRWPVIGFFVIVGCVTLVEQEALPTSIFTDRLYVFYWPPRFTGLIERPIGFLLLFILLMYICQNLVKRQRIIRGGPLLLPFLFYLLCVAGGVIHGITTGGDLKIIVLEVRPFWYMFVSYLLAYNLVSQKQHIRYLLWMLIIGACIKGIQGLYIYLILFHASLNGHNEIMAHEESFFFVALILLVVLFTLHYRSRSQLIVALLVLPCVLIATIANQRRADYIALLMGLAVALAFIFMVKPQARKGLLMGTLIFVALGGAYVAAFWHSGGSFSEPARAIASFFHPDPRDAASNLYRLIENYDLKFTEHQNPLLGMGFGKQFLQPITLPNILSLDPYYLFIPHNTIYWVWMRLGPIGYAALWFLFGAIIVRGGIIVRQLRDRYLQLVAIYIVAITFMEVIVAYADYQLFFYRNVIYLGLLIGILMKLPELDENKEQPVDEAAHSIRPFTKAGGGSQRA